MRRAFIALVAIQLLVPLAMIGWSELALARGTQVTLATVPVDPIDLFRGRYVTLSYEISTLPARGGPGRGDSVYVPLRREGDRWTGAFALTRRPDGGTFIRGTWEGPQRIVYGIETYYADEDEARRLEREAGGGLLVHVVLDGGGRARISGIEVR